MTETAHLRSNQAEYLGDFNTKHSKLNCSKLLKAWIVRINVDYFK